jgi:hypothetical protein
VGAINNAHAAFADERLDAEHAEHGAGCPRCGGRLRLIALIEEAAVIGRILRHLGRPLDLPVARAARAPPLVAVSGEAQADEYESGF